MSERFQFDDSFSPVPPAAVDANPAKAMRELLYRIACLERSVEEQRLQHSADERDLLLTIVSLYDDITAIMGRWDLATKAQEAAAIAGVIALGKKMLAILRQHHVEAIETIGRPFDAATSDVFAREAHANMPVNVVLREVQTGYTWPHGLLRRAQVVISVQNEPPSDKGPKPSSSVPAITR